ncbi:MAG: hypothetical protein JW818_22510 [Pirellulales bacterium]|nr:hypothetical protein [Pirellulales bacterium]
MKAAKCLLCVVVMLAMWGMTPALANEDALGSRLQQLEKETQALRAELQWLREHPVRLPQVEATPASMSAPAKLVADEETYTYEQVQSMMVSTAKKYAWTKGDFTIVPYGFLWGNMVYETERTAGADRSYPTYVYSAQTEGEDEFDIDGRTTRLGLDIGGPRLWPFCCAKSGGKIEFDFQGSMSATENRGGVLLRHAYVEVKNDDYRLLMGQTWDIISPLYPNTTMYSVYWNWGDIGYRRAQLRYERYLAMSSTRLLTLQFSLNHPTVSDFRTGNPHSEMAGWPLVEGRMAWTLGYRGKGGKPVVIGLSGHIGNQGFENPGVSDDVRRRTWSANLDMEVPVTSRFGLRGELQTGENLSTFLGGIGQGIDTTSLRTIRTTGGWIEAYYYIRPDLHTHVAYGADDPNDNDLVTAGSRTLNQFYFVNLMYDVTKQFRLGFEVSNLKTTYNTLRPGNSVRFEWMARYAF